MNSVNNQKLTAPYYYDDLDLYTDWEGWTHCVATPTVSSRSLAQWLSFDVLKNRLPGLSSFNKTNRSIDKTYFSPAGDLQLFTDKPTSCLVLAKFVTANALVGQAAEYRFDFTYDADGDPFVEMATTERGGQHLHTEFDVFHLTDRDPYAVRMKEFVALVAAI